MGSTDFGDFGKFCRDSTLPICNLLSANKFGGQSGPWGGCQLIGISPNDGNRLGNLGSVIVCALAVAISGFLILRSDKKKAAVGRREMQLFLLGYIIISICEVFSVGLLPVDKTLRLIFTAIHIGMIVATTWILLLNAAVGYQLIDDGTPVSLGIMVISAAVLFIGTGYIALDTGFSFTGYWDDSYIFPNRHIALYVLYQLVPLLFLVAFYLLEAFLVLRVLGEVRPMFYLTGAVVLFAIGQIFNYVVSKHICEGTDGGVDGAVFQTLFTLLSVVMVWIFWSSITEDDWPMPTADSYPAQPYE